MFWQTKKKEPFTASLPSSGEVKGSLDIYSPTWLFILKKAKTELEKARIKNDNPLLSEIQTAVLRGKIKELKKIIDLPDAGKGILNR